MPISDSNRKIYADQSKDYADSSYWRLDESLIAKKYFEGKDLLVMGCGAGRTLMPLADIARSVVAIDIIPEMVKEAQKKTRKKLIEVSEMDAAKLLYEEDSFDAVFFPFHGIDYVEPDMYAAVAEAVRVLKPDGVFIFNSHNKYFIKKIHRVFVGAFDNYRGLETYRTGLSDRWKLKRYFKKVVVKQRVSYLPWVRCNWKDKLYKLLPFFNKSTYFICSIPRK